MLADFFTKPLQGSLFRKFRDMIMGEHPIDSLKEPKSDPPQATAILDTDLSTVTKPRPFQERVGVSEKSGKSGNVLNGQKTDWDAPEPL